MGKKVSMCITYDITKLCKDQIWDNPIGYKVIIYPEDAITVLKEEYGLEFTKGVSRIITPEEHDTLREAIKKHRKWMGLVGSTELTLEKDELVKRVKDWCYTHIEPDPSRDSSDLQHLGKWCKSNLFASCDESVIRDIISQWDNNKIQEENHKE